MEEDDHMDEDWNMTKTQHDEDIDLFDDGDKPHTSTDGTHGPKGDADTSCGPGQYF